jgi:hypothetical protein
MARMFFNLRLCDGSMVLDQDGRDYLAIEDAEIDALRGARELVSTAIRHGVPIGVKELTATSSSGQTAFSVDLNVFSNIDQLIKITKAG